MQGEFAPLVKDDPRFDMELRAFLPRTYNLKAVTDYETGPGSQVTVEQARKAIQTARRFVASLISAGRPHSQRAVTRSRTRCLATRCTERPRCYGEVVLLVTVTAVVTVY